MAAVIAALALVAIQTGPVFNGVGLGSCLDRNGKPMDLRRAMLIEDEQQEIDGGSLGRIRLEIREQRFDLHLLDSDDERQIVGDIGDKVGKHGERADVFVKLGSLDSRPVLYWRETYQHRIFRQGLFKIDLGASAGNWQRVLTPMCEGRGGAETSH